MLFTHRTFEPFKFLARFREDLGRPFVVPLRATPGTSWLSHTTTWEVDGEFRYCPVTYVVRLPIPFLRPAIGFGWWEDSDVESLQLTAEHRAEIEEANLRYDAYVAVNGQIPREQYDAAVQSLRDRVGAMHLDPEAEMQLLQEMGLFV